MSGEHHGDRGSSSTSRRGADARRTTAERFDRRSASPATCSGGEAGVRSGVVVPALVTTRPDEARVDEANEVTVVGVDVSARSWTSLAEEPRPAHLRGFDSCSSRGAEPRVRARREVLRPARA